METPVEIVQGYLAALFDPAATLETIATFLHPDVVIIEHPNAIAPAGNRRDRMQALDGLLAGRELLRWQTLENLRISATADAVVVRAVWHGELARDTGPLSEGDILTAHLAMFLSVADGRIVRQENYDCYEPLPAPREDSAEPAGPTSGLDILRG